MDKQDERRVLSNGGRLEPNRLALHQVSNKIFSRKQDGKTDKFAIELLIDGSGSMIKELRDRKSFECAQKLVSVLQYVVKLNIVVFNELEFKYTPKEFLALSFDKYFYAIRTRTWEIEIDKEVYVGKSEDYFSSSEGGNWEIVNLANAVERLRSFKGRKMVICMMDGMMCMDNYGAGKCHRHLTVCGKPVAKYNEETYLPLMKQWKKEGIDLVGMGIATYKPKDFFENFVFVSDASELFPKAVEILKKLV